MCWSFGASAILTIIGIVITFYLILKKRSPLLWVPLGYFVLMELIQALTYLSLNDCSSPANQMLTFLGYIHIIFQPFFINMFSMSFIPKKVREKIYGYVYAACFIFSILMLIQLYPFDWAGSCVAGAETMCGTPICSVSGNWHLAWNLPLNGIDFGFSPYILAVFILPFIYGAWKLTLYNAVFGPMIAYFLTNNINERPAIWCLFSIAMMIIILTKPIMKWMQVKKWYIWDCMNLK